MTCAGKKTIEGNKELLSRHKPGTEYEGEKGKMKLTGTRVPIEQKRECAYWLLGQLLEEKK